MNISEVLSRLKQHFFRRQEGEKQIHFAYVQLYGKDLNTDSPVLFSEKLFSRMINLCRHGNPLFTLLADKHRVREFIRDRLGPEYLVDLIWQGDDPRLIPFDTLPAKCVIKTNHGSGGNIIWTGEENREDVILKLEQWMKQNYYWCDNEYQYYDIKPHILIEEFLDDGTQEGPLDYRFWCFHGRTAVIQVDNHLHDINPFYDRQWGKLDLYYRDNFRASDIAKPDNLSDLLETAEKLAADFDFVRVDLYSISGRIYFGEYTFTPVAGRCRLRPDSWDTVLGQKWT